MGRPPSSKAVKRNTALRKKKSAVFQAITLRLYLPRAFLLFPAREIPFLFFFVYEFKVETHKQVEFVFAFIIWSRRQTALMYILLITLITQPPPINASLEGCHTCYNKIWLSSLRQCNFETPWQELRKFWSYQRPSLLDAPLLSKPIFALFTIPTPFSPHSPNQRALWVTKRGRWIEKILTENHIHSHNMLTCPTLKLPSSHYPQLTLSTPLPLALSAAHSLSLPSLASSLSCQHRHHYSSVLRP